MFFYYFLKIIYTSQYYKLLTFDGKVITHSLFMWFVLIESKIEQWSKESLEVFETNNYIGTIFTLGKNKYTLYVIHSKSTALYIIHPLLATKRLLLFNSLDDLKYNNTNDSLIKIQLTMSCNSEIIDTEPLSQTISQKSESCLENEFVDLEFVNLQLT